ncbi:diguanylate cyclase [Sinorhizobium meliloti]|nr:diguanylate cyclase [Sinorhizobium meliloti]RVM85804.1 diguanylate cyclase [Sinorhizobium meliloti]RVN02497.1 diguanylate cyclase [Sinorhizobium meliloti]
MARHDALTGLANRQFLREAFERLLDESQGKATTAILNLDLDGFKAVNDAYGHPAGDLLLRRVAERLRACANENDVVARLGGDEFVVLRADLHNEEEAISLAKSIIDLVGAPYDLDGTHADVGVSVGLAFAPKDGRSADELIKAADIALYRAKANGRGTYRQFAPGMDAHLRAKQEMKIELRRALERGELELFYQPLINLGTKQITTCEDHVPGSGVGGGWVAAFSGMGRDDQRATAGRLMSGSSLIWLMVSSVMYLARCTAHSSFCSSRIAPTRRTMASSLGKMPTTSVLRLISPLRRSIGLVECSLARCSFGKVM